MNVARKRSAIRAVLVLGVAASIAANVLHARDNPISQTIAAWPPLALLITVEIIARIPVHSRALAAARLVATATIAGIAAWVSYWHMADVASRYGETGASPYLLPLSVDGLIVVASICLVELSGQTPDTDTTVTGPDNTVGPAVSPVLQYARPIGPQPEPPATETDTTPTAKPTLSNRKRVAAAHRQTPKATNAQLAERLDVSVKTVERYRPPRPANGHVPQLAKTP
ncbi:DUF2637 domain-containing protein [Actinoplanes sp. NPDC049118]|uniref:DUF2637 domain-containing protein n=1 Tax=Actinoplanes sp. NPDC049118 TaxID=3155769 RepID=UPI0033EA41B3